MDFMTGLSLFKDYNAIIITINRLIKKRYYIPCFAGEDGILTKVTINMLIKEVFRLYGLLTSIISDRGSQFIVTI